MQDTLFRVLLKRPTAFLAGSLVLWVLVSLATLALYVAAFTGPFFLGSHYTMPQLTWVSMVGYQPEIGLAYTGVILALFGTYYLGFRALSLNPGFPGWAIYLPPVSFALALLAIYPADGWDLFVYISQGRLFVLHGLSPFLVSPQAVPQDLLYAYSSWVSHVSIYGPVWLVISSVAAYLGGDNLWLTMLLFKLPPIVFLFASVALVYLISDHINPRYRNLAAFLLAWNPLVLFEVAGNGHNDIVMVFFALLALYLLARQRSVFSLPSLVVSALVKYTSMVLLPGLVLYILRSKAKSVQNVVSMAGGFCLSAAVLYLFVRPFGMALSLEALSGQSESFRSSIATLLFYSLRGSFAPNEATTIATSLVGVAFAVAYLSLFVKFLRQNSDGHLETLIQFSAYSLFFLLLFLPRFLAWYTVWLLGIAVLLPESGMARRAVMLSLTAFLSHILYYFVWGIYGDRLNSFTLETMGTALVFGPPLVYWLCCRSKSRRDLLRENNRLIALQETEIARLKALLSRGRREP